MKLVIVDDKKIHHAYIPDEIAESYVFSLRPYKFKEDIMISIEKDSDSKVYLKTNGSVSVIESDSFVDKKEFLVDNCYKINIDGFNRNLDIYTYPTISDKSYLLDFGTLSKIVVGNSLASNICFKALGVLENHFEIDLINGEWNFISHGPSYLNSNYMSASKLVAGDIIFLGGLKIVWMNTFIMITAYNLNLVSVSGFSVKNRELSNDIYVSQNKSDDVVFELFEEKDYFYHSPRLRDLFKEVNVEIDSPPSSQIGEDLPSWLTIGTTLTMMASSFMLLYNVGYSLGTGSRSVLSLVPQIVMCVAMLIGGLIIPKFANKYKKKIAEQREALRQQKYSEYLLERERIVSNYVNEERQILLDETIETYECTSVIDNRNRHFWSRDVNDDDFLSVVLGIGNKDSLVTVSAPEKHFSLDHDNLLEMVYTLGSKYKTLTDIPLTFSFLENKLTAIISNSSCRNAFINGIILKLVTTHSPMDLKIVMLTSSDSSKTFDYLKMYPHLFSSDKTDRYYAKTTSEVNDLLKNLDEIYKERKIEQNEGASDDDIDIEVRRPYFLIMCDDYQLIKTHPLIDTIINSKSNLGFSVVLIDNSMKNIPTDCNNFIEFDDNSGVSFSKNISSTGQKSFKPDFLKDVDLRGIGKKLMNIPVVTLESAKSLPSSLSFLDMYGVSKIEQLNIIGKWRENNPVNSLSAPIGLHASGDIFNLNLHEKEHGPHGLIAGSTGSGKSEFIISYILSMAINYHPYEVQFVLIDYKGGGLAGAFENKETNVRIPHLVGTITNLDISEMNRTLVSINSEVKRRQRVFNEVRDRLGEGTIDIYKYQRLYREGMVEKPMAHLFIISDEFAELKSQQPEFMAELISIARIGRSLGVHLILATQKPSGVVNDQIWSNSKFKICLKVQNKSDSNEMLKRPDAASLKEVGRFYLQIGYDEYFDIGQSGWAGAKYTPKDKIVKKVDTSLSFIDNIGNNYKSIRDLHKEVEVKDNGDQLTNIVKYLHNLGEKEEILRENLWMNAIPSEIYLDDLKTKYSYEAESYVIKPIIGEYDVPSEQRQGLLTLDLTNSGNTLIYGQSGSGKENLLSTIIWSSSIYHTPDEVNFYVIDCGAEVLKRFYNLPHVGEILGVSDGEKIPALFEQLFNEIEERKKLFMDYSGNYNEYITQSGDKLPLIVTIINSYEVFVENFSKLSENVQTIYRDGAKYGVIFIISSTTTNAIRSRSVQFFTNIIALKLAGEMDYRNVLGSPKGLTPASHFGRGLTKVSGTASEFQTAYICDKENLSSFIRDASKQLSSAYTTKAKNILMIPSYISFDLFKDTIYNLNDVPIGFVIKKKLPYTMDFTKNKILNVLTSSMDGGKMSFIYAIVDALKNINVSVKVIDLVNAYERREKFVPIIKNDFENHFMKMNNEIITNSDAIDNPVFYIILGTSNIKNNIGAGTSIIESLFNRVNTLNNVHFILVDNVSGFMAIEELEFIKNNVDYKSGIWLGGNIQSQRLFEINNLNRDDALFKFNELSYIIDNGEYAVVKHMLESDSNG